MVKRGPGMLSWAQWLPALPSGLAAPRAAGSLPPFPGEARAVPVRPRHAARHEWEKIITTTYRLAIAKQFTAIFRAITHHPPDTNN